MKMLLFVTVITFTFFQCKSKEKSNKELNELLHATELKLRNTIHERNLFEQQLEECRVWVDRLENPDRYQPDILLKD
ncbi:MAG: hypothetical protein ACSHW7_01825 [Patiriisocius sp.]|uniref:hypothetical protein n=1 Tax=Patiriisocius sp. TaxID=2822396 RepID=UPI003EF4340F